MSHDVIVIGAGPAGMAAATEAAGFGLSVLVLDEQSAAGGQRFRAIERTVRATVESRKRLDKDEARGAAIVRRFHESGVTYVPQASVWDVSLDPCAVSYVHEGVSTSIRSKAIVAANGAFERPVPLPGWTLPGVMTAGAAQGMMKTSGRAPEGRIVLVGNGPLLLLTTRQLRNAGADVVALLQATSFGDFVRAIPDLPHALPMPRLLSQGAGLLVEALAVKSASSLQAVKILGRDRVSGVEYVVGRRTKTIECDVVLLHFGVIPNTQITRLARADHVWNERQSYWQPVLDAWQETSVPKLMVAGDGGGVLGWEAAELSGRRSVLKIAHELGAITQAERDRIARDLGRKLNTFSRARTFVDVVYQPPANLLQPDGDTLVCRCEDVTASEIAAVVENGGFGMRRLKACVRTGMGPCRGQMCAMATAAILAKELRAELGSIQPSTVRPPLRPLTLGELASTGFDG